MATEQLPMLLDEGCEAVLFPHVEQELLQMDTIYWCDWCNVYHINIEYSWDDISAVLARAAPST